MPCTSILCAVALTLLPPASGTRGVQPPAAAEAKAEVVGASPFEWADSAFVADAALAQRLRSLPPRFDTEVWLEGQPVVVRWERIEVIRPGFEARVGSRARPELAEVVKAMAQFQGEVIGEAGSVAHLAVSDRGAAGFVDRGSGRGRFTLRPVSGDQPGLAQGLVRFDRSGGVSQPEVPLCGAEDAGGGVAGAGAVPPGVVPVIEIAVDTDFEYFAIFNDATAASEYVAALYGAVAAIYRRDVDATIGLTYLRLWDTPDDLFNESDPLYPFRDWWNENQGGVHRDLAHLLTGRRNLPYGGVAWLNSACGSNGYAVVGYLIGRFADPFLPHPGNWDVIVLAHELGHNVGSLHTHSYGLDNCAGGETQRGSIMSYCHINSGATANIDLYFHRVCADAMEGYMVSVDACLASDCDGDGISDAEAIAQGLAIDSNGDGIPDACQDCDGDGVPDPVAIASGLVADVDSDNRPDVCEPDCNGNGIPDSEDIASGASLDAYGNGVPDECESDCDASGGSDYTQIQAEMSLDRSRDARIDACEDCDGDGVADFDELQGSTSVWVARADSSEVRELHPRSGVVMHVLSFDPGVVYDLAIGPDGYLYASVGSRIERVDRVARQVLGTVFTFAGGVTARGLAFADDGMLLVATSQGEVRRIDVDSGQDIGPLFAGAIPDPRDVGRRADGRVLVSCGDGRVRQYQPDGTGGVLIDDSASQHDFVGLLETPDGESILVVSRGRNEIRRFDGATGAFLGRFDVQASGFLSSPWGIAASADGRAAVATGAAASSTVNGYRFTTGYLERTYRVYPTDAPAATAIVVAPPSASDRNGNLVPDECEPAPADLDGDGTVGPADLAILLGAWGTAAADLDGDGTTDATDLAILLGSWS